MTTPAKKPNGSKPRVPLSCPHADDCAAPQMHAEVMASLDQLGTGLGLVLQDTETKDRHLNHLTEQMSDVLARLNDTVSRLTVAEQREERWLLELASITRSTAQESVRAVHAELLPIVRSEVERLRSQEPKE